MAGSSLPSYTPSADFIALCQAQIELLQHSLAVDWCGVYLTQGGGNAPLTPVAVSPLSTNAANRGADLEQTICPLPSTALTRVDPHPDPSTPFTSDFFGLGAPPFDPERRLVIPLIHQEMVLGVLVSDRTIPPWYPAEMEQLEMIAQSLAIACLMDQHQGWYRSAWEQQQQQQQLERQRWADLLHQFRNPLTALKTFSKLLVRRWQGDEKDRQIIEGILREGGHLQELMQSFERERNSDPLGAMLALPKSETSSLALPAPTDVATNSTVLSPVDLSDILLPVLEAEQAIAAERAITVQFQLPDSLPLVRGNASVLREVFSNLLDNAVKYTPDGGLVIVHCPCPEPCPLPTADNCEPDSSPLGICVAIADTGYGIPPTDQPHIFERHYRGQQADSDITGTGLGLAIVKTLVDKMQGAINFTSPNHLSADPQYPGTTFTLWLPLP